MKRPVRTFVARHGETATLHNFTDDGSRDAYGDPSFTETTTTVDILFEIPGGGTDTRGPAGADELVTAIIRISTAETVHEPTDAHPRPSEFTRDATGSRYKVQAKVDTGNGLYECQCSQGGD